MSRFFKDCVMHRTFWQIVRSLVLLRTNVFHSAQRGFLGMTGKQHENAFRSRTCKSFLFYYLHWGFSQRFSSNYWTQDGFSLRDEKKCFLSREAKRNYESKLRYWKIAFASIQRTVDVDWMIMLYQRIFDISICVGPNTEQQLSGENTDSQRHIISFFGHLPGYY